MTGTNTEPYAVILGHHLRSYAQITAFTVARIIFAQNGLWPGLYRRTPRVFPWAVCGMRASTSSSQPSLAGTLVPKNLECASRINRNYVHVSCYGFYIADTATRCHPPIHLIMKWNLPSNSGLTTYMLYAEWPDAQHNNNHYGIRTPSTHTPHTRAPLLRVNLDLNTNKCFSILLLGKARSPSSCRQHKIKCISNVVALWERANECG